MVGDNDGWMNVKMLMAKKVAKAWCLHAGLPKGEKIASRTRLFNSIAYWTVGHLGGLIDFG
jgi:hypothetical protein